MSRFLIADPVCGTSIPNVFLDLFVQKFKLHESGCRVSKRAVAEEITKCSGKAWVNLNEELSRIRRVRHFDTCNRKLEKWRFSFRSLDVAWLRLARIEFSQQRRVLSIRISKTRFNFIAMVNWRINTRIIVEQLGLSGPGWFLTIGDSGWRLRFCLERRFSRRRRSPPTIHSGPQAQMRKYESNNLNNSYHPLENCVDQF